jgi:hydroxyethylthiazole kinase-like uncharacterized protein yjeF
MKVVSIEEMRAMERAADAGGHTYAEMMERAGLAVADVAQNLLGQRASPSVVALVGPGNNGGDGLVAARHLAAAGMRVCALCCKRDLTKDEMSERAQAAGVEIAPAGDEQGIARLQRWLETADLILDALLGTGATRAIEGEMKAVLVATQAAIEARRLRRANGQARPTLVDLKAIPKKTAGEPLEEAWPKVLAVDCPSGLNCDTGALDPVALSADVTVTFAYPKWGHFLFPGAGALGRLIVADIGIPEGLAEGVKVEVMTPGMARAWLPPRSEQAHKGTFGKAMIIAGSTNYTGAAYLAGAAATRVGAGLVTLAVAEPLHAPLAAALHETTWLLLPHDLGVLAPGAADLVHKRLPEYDALLLGCGFGTEKATAEFLEALLTERTKAAAPRIGFIASKEKKGVEMTSQEPTPFPPLVLDADGLNLLAQMPDWAKRLPTPTILTPHPGEMARLCGCETKEVEADRLNVARRRAEEWGHVVVLKGAHTICAAPDGRTIIQPFANPALATAGTGDVLAGAIVGLLAQGMVPLAAAALGCYLHGLAGELVRREIGSAGAVASDLLSRLPRAICQLRWSGES